MKVSLIPTTATFATVVDMWAAIFRSITLISETLPLVRNARR